MDTRIALGVNPINIPDPAAPLQRALTLQALTGQADLQGLQVQEGQRTLRQNQAMDALAQSAGSNEEYLAGLRKINPAAAIKLEGDLLTRQKTQSEVNKGNTEAKSQLAAAFISLPPEQQAAQYPSLIKQWNALNLPGDKMIESEQFRPEFLPHLQQIAAAGLHPKDALERGDEARAGTVVPRVASPAAAALAGPSAMPTQPQDVADPSSGATVRALQPDAVAPPVAIAQNAPPPLAVLPTQTVTGKAPEMTPEDYRRRADALRAQGTKASREAAKEDYNAANQLEMRAQSEQKNSDINDRFHEREKRLSAAVDGADLRPEDALFVARQIIAGNQSAGAGLARNQKAKTAVIRALTDEATAQGMSPADVAAKVAEFSGVQAGQRTLGTRQANLGVAIEELKGFVPLAQTASDAVSRTGFVPLNKLLQMGTNQWSPEQAQFVAANRAVINSFAQIAARGGTNVHSMVEAENMINTAQTPEQYTAVLKQLMSEATAAGKAPGVVRKELSDAVAGRTGEAPGAPGVTAAPKKGVGDGTQANPVKIKGQDGFDMLKSGQWFSGPDGKTRQKP